MSDGLAAVTARLDAIDAKLEDLVADRKEVAGILESMSTAMTAMSEGFDALLEAALEDDDGGVIHTLDGTVEGGARNDRQPLEDPEQPADVELGAL